MYIVEHYVSEYNDDRHSDTEVSLYTRNKNTALKFIRGNARRIVEQEFKEYYPDLSKFHKWLPDSINLNEHTTKYYVGCYEKCLYHVWLLKSIECMDGIFVK